MSIEQFHNMTPLAFHTFYFWTGFHYVLFLEYISVDADDQDSDSSVDSN